ncbi:MAG: hypothetical protein EOO07_06350 [Chitinophagaceae bacterium]|nr:MAG: hypothetical protein EOO07_06350 [Chitinophagaceae bacterium]
MLSPLWAIINELMKFTKLILLLFYTMHLSSCDPGSTIKYEVVNKTKEQVIVEYQFVYNAKGDTSLQEANISGQTSKILNVDMPLGYVDHVDERNITLPIHQLRLKWNGKVTRQDFKERKHWKLIKSNENEATYQLIVDSLTFEEE